MKQVQKILVATDRSEMANEALKRAISVAKKKDAQLFIIHVIEPPFMESPYLKPFDQNDIKKEIKEKIDSLNIEAKVEYNLFIENGNIADMIIYMADKLGTDLIIIGSHGKKILDSDYFGSSTLEVIQRTHLPVLVVKNEVKGIYQKMIAPTNLSSSSKQSIVFANTLFTKPEKTYLFAHETFSELQSKTYYISEEHRRNLLIELEISAKDRLRTFTQEIAKGKNSFIHFKASVNEDILEYIIKDKADLLVLGSKGVDNLNSFVFGSTASYLLQRSPIDVLIFVPN